MTDLPVDLLTENKYISDRLSKIDSLILNEENELAQLKTTATNSNPLVKQIEEKIKHLSKQRNQFNNQIKLAAVSRVKLGLINNEVSANTQLYQKMTGQIEQLFSLKKEVIGDIQIIQQATIPHTSTSYSRLRIIAIFLALGLLIGLIISMVFN